MPPGYTSGSRLPVVMWAYPTEFASAAAAGQVFAAPNRFNIIRGPSHLFFLTQGYAVMDANAFGLCKENKLPIVVFNINQPGATARVLAGERVGTIVQ